MKKGTDNLYKPTLIINQEDYDHAADFGRLGKKASQSTSIHLGISGISMWFQKLKRLKSPEGGTKRPLTPKNSLIRGL
jgi:hypothetical protein